jgi:hypothetical protein
MKKLSLFLALFIAFSFFACDDDTSTPDVVKSGCPLFDGKEDYLVFGTYRGFCAGDCVSLFKITTNELFADNMTGRFDKPLSFNASALSSDKYAIAAALCAKFPLESTNAIDVTLGCPDCHDQGVVYVELKRGSVIRTWKIDPDDNASGVPTEIRAYAKLISEITDKLK